MKNKILAVLFASAWLTTSCGAPSTDLTDLDIATPELVVTLMADGTGVTMTNAAAAGTEIPLNVSRAYIDFSSYSMIRAHFASSLTSTVVQTRIDYSLDDGTTWSTLVPPFSASTVANANSTSTWGSIPGDAHRSVMVRAVTIGDGALDPIIRYVRIGYF